MRISRDIDVFSPNQYEDVYYEAPIVAKRAPTTSDKQEIGKVWIDTTNDDAYFMTSVVANSAVWINAGGGSGTFTSITATTGNITADAGNFVATLGDLSIVAGTVTIGALTAGIMQTSAAGVVSSSTGTDGQIMIADTGGVPAWATLTAGAGINITNAANSITVTATGAVASTFPTDAGTATPAGGAVTMAGGTNMNTAGAGSTVTINLDASPSVAGSLTAGVDLTMTSGVCTITGTTDAAQTIYLRANGGVSETLDIHSDQGTGVDSVWVHSDVGGLTLASGLASADAINIAAAAGGVDIDGTLTINIASSKNASDAVVLSASAGGIDITSAGGAAEDIDITASSSINLLSTEDAAESIYLHANGGITETIRIHSDQGTNVASINIDSDVGGITLTATANATNDAINLSAPAGGIDVDAALQVNVTSSQVAADAIVIDASDAGGGIDLDYGTGGFTIDGANGALTIQTGTGDISIGADAVEHNLTLGNVTGDTVINLNSGTGGIALASTGAGDITINSSDTVLIDSAGVLELNSSAGVINIANDDIDQNVNISTDGVRILTLGSANTTASVVVNSGTTESSFAANGTDHTTKVGSVTGTSASTLQSGTGAMTFTAGGTFDVNATGAVTVDSSGGTIGIGIDDIDQAINIGTVGERVVTIGNIVGVTGIALNAGTGSIALASTGASPITVVSGSTVLIDGAGVIELNSSAGVISIGNDDIDQNINVGTDGARTVTLGSENTTAATAVKCGTGGLNVGTSANAHTTTLGSTDTTSDTTVQSGTGGITLSAAGIVDVVPATSSVAGTALTISANVGVGTFTGLTTAAGATETLTITNTLCTTSSAILLSSSNLGAGDAQMTVTRITPGAGSFTVQLENLGAANLNGNIIVTFWILAL